MASVPDVVGGDQPERRVGAERLRDRVGEMNVRGAERAEVRLVAVVQQRRRYVVQGQAEETRPQVGKAAELGLQRTHVSGGRVFDGEPRRDRETHLDAGTLAAFDHLRELAQHV